MSVGATARALLREAAATNERRLLVLAGERATGVAALERLTSDDDLLGDDVVAVSPGEIVGRRLSPRHTQELLGTTHDAVVVDCHDECRPNTLGRAVGAVDGGGLLVLVTPPLDAWAERRDKFDEGLAPPPFGIEDVRGCFRSRLVETLRAHRGVAIVDVDADEVEDDGLTHPAPRLPAPAPQPPAEHAFPAATYEACLSTDQVEAVAACERLRTTGEAVVIAADRGRGKSSAAGLAAGALAADGRDVLVTARGYRNAREVLARAGELLAALDVLAVDDRARDTAPAVEATGGGAVRFRRPVEAVESTADVFVVDEAAALPVRVLESLLAVAPSVCFATTVHGYEGAGRGFDVRFRDRLAASDFAVTDVSMTDPIRYATDDPIEVWAFRALLLNARPPVTPLVEDATPTGTRYVALDPRALAADDRRLREVFGSLVYAHYRTEPDDLARLLDAPNVAIRALLYEGHVVSVALLAREGGLAAATRREMYEGERVRGNMLPDVLTSQLRDETAGEPVGLRVLRIATHHAVRSRGLGSRLLEAVRTEFSDAQGPGGDAVDWLGVGYGATPDLVAFWAANDYRTVHLSTTRNDASGEYSVLMLAPLTDAGRRLHARSAEWFVRRITAVLTDPLADADPDVVRACLATTDARVPLALTDREWRVVAAAAYGPGLYDVAPRPFRRLALRALVDDETELDTAAERLLVRKVLQAWPWRAVVDDLEYVSRRTCMRALGAAYRPLVDRYGTDAAHEEADRYR